MLVDTPVWHLAAREGGRAPTVLNCALGLECGAAHVSALRSSTGKHLLIYLCSFDQRALAAQDTKKKHGTQRNAHIKLDCSNAVYRPGQDNVSSKLMKSRFARYVERISFNSAANCMCSPSFARSWPMTRTISNASSCLAFRVPLSAATGNRR